MELFISYFGSALLGLISALVAYLKIRSERKASAKTRDDDSLKIHDELLKHSFELQALKDDRVLVHQTQDDLQKQISALSESVAKLSVSVEHFSKAVDELRADIRDMRPALKH